MSHSRDQMTTVMWEVSCVWVSEHVSSYGKVDRPGTVGPDALNSSGPNHQPDCSPAIWVPSLSSRTPENQWSCLHLLTPLPTPWKSPADPCALEAPGWWWSQQPFQGICGMTSPTLSSLQQGLCPGLALWGEHSLAWLLGEPALPIPTFAGRAVFSPLGVLAQGGSELPSATSGRAGLPAGLSPCLRVKGASVDGPLGPSHSDTGSPAAMGQPGALSHCRCP